MLLAFVLIGIQCEGLKLKLSCQIMKYVIISSRLNRTVLSRHWYKFQKSGNYVYIVLYKMVVFVEAVCVLKRMMLYSVQVSKTK